MADFKDVILRLQENKNDNREVIEKQSSDLINGFREIVKSQNRSFGQSLALQQKRTNEALGGLGGVFKSEDKGDDKVEATQSGSLANIAQILTDIHGSIMNFLVVTKTQLDENERLRLLQTGGGAGPTPGVTGADEQKQSGRGLGMLGIGALAGAALAGAKGLAMMGVAISAFFGGLVAGDAALSYLDADLNFTKIKEAAKGFSGIVAELSPEAMVSLGAIMAVSAVGGTKAALGVGAFGAGISAFFAGLLLGDAIFSGISALGYDFDFAGIKQVVKGFGSIIDEMSVATRITLGSMLVAGTALGFAGKGAVLKATMGIAALSAGIGGFFVGLALADTLVEGLDYLTGAADLGNIKKVIDSIGGIISGLDETTLASLGLLIGTGVALGTISRSPLKAGLAVATLGAGIGGFFVGLALSDAGMSYLNSDFTAIANATAGFSNAIDNLSTEALATLGVLLAAGGLLGSVTSVATQTKMVLGIGALSLGIAAFFAGFSAADFVAANVGDGSNVVTLMSNFSAAVGALDTNALTALTVLLGAGALFGATGLAGPAAIGMGLIGAGIAAFFLAFEGLAAIGDVIGLDGSNTKKLIGNMVDGVKRLNEIDGKNLNEVVGPLALVGPAILAFMGSKGLGGLVSGTIGAAKDGFNYLKSFFVDPGPKGPTLIESMIDLLKPLEDFDASNIQGFIDTSNALTNFINNDYRKGADDFEYFVNKVAGLAPVLEGAIFGGMSVDGIEVQGLANGGDGYFQAQKNIMMLKNALSENQMEMGTIQAEGAAGGPANINANSTSVQNTNVNSQSTFSVASSTQNQERTVGMMNSINGSQYSMDPFEPSF